MEHRRRDGAKSESEEERETLARTNLVPSIQQPLPFLGRHPKIECFPSRLPNTDDILFLASLGIAQTKIRLVEYNVSSGGGSFSTKARRLVATR